MDLAIVAFITEACPVPRILTHIGGPAHPPAVAPALGPPGRDEAAEPLPVLDPLEQPE
jgi:hypothetical protein